MIVETMTTLQQIWECSVLLYSHENEILVVDFCLILCF